MNFERTKLPEIERLLSLLSAATRAPGPSTLNRSQRPSSSKFPSSQYASPSTWAGVGHVYILARKAGLEIWTKGSGDEKLKLVNCRDGPASKKLSWADFAAVGIIPFLGSVA